MWLTVFMRLAEMFVATCEEWKKAGFQRAESSLRIYEEVYLSGFKGDIGKYAY